MSLQIIIDRAQQIEFDRKRIVGQSVSRSQRMKTAERASAVPWRWIVTPPANMKWSQSRDIVEDIMTNDRITETEINLAQAGYLSAYRGELNNTQLASLRITATTTASVTLDVLPAIGAAISQRNYVMTARSFTSSTSATYNRALDTTRTDFLITTAEYDANYYSIQPGDVLTSGVYISGAQVINNITRNYIQLGGTDFTRIVMDAPPNQSTTATTTATTYNILVQSTKTTLVDSNTYVFRKGDIIQPSGSRYPYMVTNNLQRGLGTTITATLHRALITSEGITLTNRNLKIGSSATWRMVLVTLPNVVALPYDRMAWSAEFELIEKII